MKSRSPWAPPSFVFVLFSTAFLLLSPAAARAQDIFVTPIPNVPFSAVVRVERSWVQPDGSASKLKTERQIARDSRGRIYNEGRTLVPVSSDQSPEVIRIHLYDPGTRTSTILDPKEHRFWTTIVNRPPPTVPPALLDATPAGNSLEQNEFTKKEDLGIREINGIPAQGIRETQTIAAGPGGTAQTTVITDEYWYSDDLRINLLIKHHDPRRGAVTLIVSQLQRTEPDAAIFEIPRGYKPVGPR